MITVNLAISRIHAPKGMTSLISGLNAGDLSVVPHQKGLEADIQLADAKIEEYRDALNKCESDWSYWSILGDKIYWEAVRNILEAGLLNKGLVVDVAKPDLDNCVVIDAIGKVEKYGEEVLEKTKEAVRRA